MKKLGLFILSFLLISNAFSQYKLIETDKSTTDKKEGGMMDVSIPYSKYQFDNGLTLIINEDHSDPVVSVNLTYRIGSSTNYADRTGITYIIANLFNQGSKNVESGEFEKTIRNYGGESNIYFEKDRTTLATTAPSSLLETILWMESDRMGFFTDAISEEIFFKTKEELIQFVVDSLNNNKLGPNITKLEETLYPYSHPYSWPLFGKVEHLNNIKLNDLKKFFLDWYGPNNAILTISGDIENDDVLKLVNNYFGGFAKAKNSTNAIEHNISRIYMNDASSLFKDRYYSYEYDVENPVLKIVYPTVEKYNDYQLYFDYLAKSLNERKSVLYEQLLVSRLAKSFNVVHKSYMHSGELIIEVEANGDTSLSVIKDVVVKAIASSFDPLAGVDEKKELKPEEIEAIEKKRMQIQKRLQWEVYDDLFSYMNNYKFQKLKSLELTKAKAEKLTEYELYKNNPGFLNKDLEKTRMINPDMLMRVVSDYIIDKPKVIISVVPFKKKELVAGKNNFTHHNLQTIIEHIDEKDLKSIQQKSQEKDSPKIKKVSKRNTPSYNLSTYQNGLRIITAKTNDGEMLNISLYINTKKFDDPFQNYLSTEVVKEYFIERKKYNQFGEQDIPFSEISNNMDVYTSDFGVVLSLSTLNQDIMLTREFFNELLRESGNSVINPESAFNRLNTANANVSSKRILAYPQITDSCTLSREVLGGEDPLKIMTGFIAESIPALISPENSILVISGNVDEAQLMDFLENFRQWFKPNFEMPDAGYVNNPEDVEEKQNEKEVITGNPIFIVKNDNIKTPKVIIKYMDIPYQNFEEAVKGNLLNYIIGRKGDFENKANFLQGDFMRKKNKSYYLSFNSNEGNVAKSINSVISELDYFGENKIQGKIYRALKNQYLYNGFTSYEENSQKSEFVYNSIISEYPDEFFNKQRKKVKWTWKNAFRKFADANLNSENYKIIVVGNEDKLKKELTNSGFKNIVVIDNTKKTDHFNH
ncbi:MAG: insulinase family protein [Bacteroidota bacterium]|nr:insulinase family protein [Bacteroidota bacterium]